MERVPWPWLKEMGVQTAFALMHALYCCAVVALLWAGHLTVTRTVALTMLTPLGILSALAVMHHARRVWRLLHGEDLGVAYLQAPMDGSRKGRT